MIVSANEPVSVSAPFDLMWLRTDGTFLKRTQKSSDGTYEHTWVPVTEENFWAAQTWDVPQPSNQDILDLQRLVGNAHLLTLEDLGGLSAAGGIMSGPLGLRTVDESDYADNEALPRSIVEGWVNTAKTLAYSVYTQLTSVRNSVTAVRGRVTILENRVNDLTVSGVPNHIHEQYSPNASWIIDHNLGDNAIASVFSFEGEYMIPSSIIRLTDSRMVISFAQPRTGKANIYQIGQ
jgi:hypothetical protein